MAQHREVLSRITFPDAAGIFIETDVQAPMDRVRDRPMQAHRIFGLFGVARQTTDVVAGIDRDLIAVAAFKLDLRDRAQRLPLAALTQIADIPRISDRPAVADL